LAIHLSSRPDFLTADFQLAHRLSHVLAIYDSIAPEHVIRFPATDLHDDGLRYPGPPQVTRSGAAKVMQVQPRYSSRFGHSCPLITHSFVDLYKIGRVNYLPMTKTTDWKDYTERMVELCAKLGVTHYFKKDLQQYLPAGYVNVLRHDQHH
jgi:hypothetical protein